MYFVYILYSKSINRYYVGYSINPERRLSYHNRGKSGSKSAFTKRAKDWEIVYKRGYQYKSEAREFENYIKRMKSKRYIKSLIKDAR